MAGRVYAIGKSQGKLAVSMVELCTLYRSSEGQGWFLSFHCFTKYIKVTMLNGASLHPLPPVASKHPDVRYFHIHEDEERDEELVRRWIAQASKLPGDALF